MKLVSLTRGYFAKVDDEDYDRVSKFKWHVCITKENRKYAARNVRVGPRSENRVDVILMHRFILSAPPNTEVDHRDLDALNNVRSNIRITDAAGNRRNRAVRKDSASGFKGVQARSGKWRARIRINEQMKTLGTFFSQEEAAKAYDKMALELHGEFARTNFSTWKS